MDTNRVEQLTLQDVLDVLDQYDLCHVDGMVIHPGTPAPAYGYCDHEKKKIFLDETRKPRTRVKTLLHEIVHAYNELNNLRDSERSANRVSTRTFREVYGHD